MVVVELTGRYVFSWFSLSIIQDDVVMGTLSVRENLHFSAALRLPANTTFKQRKERVEKVIDELGLQKCAKSKVFGWEYVHCVYNFQLIQIILVRRTFLLASYPGPSLQI